MAGTQVWGVALAVAGLVVVHSLAQEVPRAYEVEVMSELDQTGQVKLGNQQETLAVVGLYELVRVDPARRDRRCWSSW